MICYVEVIKAGAIDRRRQLNLLSSIDKTGSY
jgi:hypothetical protein